MVEAFADWQSKPLRSIAESEGAERYECFFAEEGNGS